MNLLNGERESAYDRNLRLWTGFVSRDEEECSVHDGSAIEHGGHQDVVSGAVDKRHVAAEVVSDLGLWVDVIVRSLRAKRFIAIGSRCRFVHGAVDFGIGIAQFDRDVPFQLS